MVLFIWDCFPVELVAVGSRALAVGHGGAQPVAEHRRLRRSDGHLHRHALRRERGARRDRRHGLGRSAADRGRRREQDAPDRPDDAAGRRTDGADQRQRLGRGTDADGRAARDPPSPAHVAAPAPARLRRPRGLAAHPDGNAGQRDRERLGEERRGGAVRVLRLRARRRAARGRRRSRSSSSSASGCCRTATESRSHPTSAGMRGRSRASTSSRPTRARSSRASRGSPRWSSRHARDSSARTCTRAC